jgi:hypothetical protein
MHSKSPSSNHIGEKENRQFSFRGADKATATSPKTLKALLGHSPRAASNDGRADRSPTTWGRVLPFISLEA